MYHIYQYTIRENHFSNKQSRPKETRHKYPIVSATVVKLTILNCSVAMKILQYNELNNRFKTSTLIFTSFPKDTQDFILTVKIMNTCNQTFMMINHERRYCASYSTGVIIRYKGPGSWEGHKNK